MKVTVLGTGAYGIALALMLKKNDKITDLVMWTKFEKEKEEIERLRENKKVLPNIIIPSEISFTTNMEEAIDGSSLIVVAIPAAFCEDVFIELAKYYKTSQHICIATKGIQQESCLFMNELLEKYISTKNISAISGPSFAIDIANNAPIGLSLATESEDTSRVVKSCFDNDTMILKENDDILGTEICGAIKNVIAIAAGILAGMGMPESTQAMLITESLHDIKRLIIELGGRKNTVISFAGIGDLLLTCTSTKSRNYKFGLLIGSMSSQEEIDNYINNNTIEGLYTLKSIYKLTKDRNINIPIIDLIYEIVFKDKDPNNMKSFLTKKL